MQMSLFQNPEPDTASASKPDSEPKSIPKGTLWQSKGIWDNGKARTLTGHHEYDISDKLAEVAGGRTWNSEEVGNPWRWRLLFPVWWNESSICPYSTRWKDPI